MARVHAGDDEGDVRSRERLQMSPDPLERVVVGDLDDAGVEGDIDDGLGVGVARVGRSLHLVDVALEFFEVRVRHPGQGEPRAEGLELGPDPIRLEQLGLARMPDAGPAECRDLDDPERLEVAQCFSHGSLAGAKLPCNSGLDDSGAGRVVAGQDLLQEAILDLIAQGAA